MSVQLRIRAAINALRHCLTIPCTLILNSQSHDSNWEFY
jgi:hypothetical protein